MRPLTASARTARTEAERYCEAAGIGFAEAFRYQYAISRAPLGLPGFREIDFGGWCLQLGGALPTDPIRAVDGRVVGHLFGVGASHDGLDAASALSEGLDPGAADVIDRFEDRLTRVVGRYGAIVHLEGRTRLYCDATGMIGVVFDREGARVASSPGLCVDRPFVTDPRLPADGPRGLTLTVDAHVERLTCNHRLDLETFETARFWPRDGDRFVLDRADYGAAIDEMIAAVRNVLRSHTAQGPVSYPLSGGLDSRAILALADDETIARADQIYTHVMAKVNLHDASVANQLCDLLGVGLEVHNRMRKRRFTGSAAERDFAETYRAATGRYGPVPNFVDRTQTRVVRDAVVMRGQQIPIMRALFVGGEEGSDWTAREVGGRILTLLGYQDMDPDHLAVFEKAIEAQKAELPGPAQARALDLLLTETVNGPELASYFCSQSHCFYSSPFNGRRLIQLMSGFDTEERRSSLIVRLMMLRARPSFAGLIDTREAATIWHREENASVRVRHRRVTELQDAYAAVFSEPAPHVPMIRFRFDGIKDTVNPRDLRLETAPSDVADPDRSTVVPFRASA